MHLKYDQIAAAGAQRNGQLWMAARCPHCALVSIVIFDKLLKPMKRERECSHFVSPWVEAKQILFNFQRA